MHNNEELKKIKEEAENKIYKTVLVYLTNTQEGKELTRRVLEHISQSELIGIVKEFSQLSSKQYNDIIIKSSNNLDDFMINMLIDKNANVSYSSNIAMLKGFYNAIPGVKVVSHAPFNSFSTTERPSVHQSKEFLVYMSLVKMADGYIANELIFYMKEK